MSDPYLPSTRADRSAAPDPSTGSESERRGSNRPEYSVSEISGAVKRAVEDQFGHIRVRGEISRPRKPGSGHLYLTLKDENAVLDAVAWRGVVSRLAIRPEEGMEVIVTGRLTTYPGQSKYQLIVEQMELAGEGALLKLLEDRKRKLSAEGLFAPDRKRPLPYLPPVIGVITSPTGAVIRDILHRLADRFPRPVLVWPVRVQGDTCGREVAAAIAGFNALPAASQAMPGAVVRPDVLIVARGGGSLEDLMGFNEEAVVRAVAESSIPVISAVGHETDTTLIDLVADRRAPTPTAAAEMAVPVRGELIATLEDLRARQGAALHRLIAERRERVAARAGRLGDPARLLEAWVQRLDDRSDRLDRAAQVAMDRQTSRLMAAGDRLIHPARSLMETGRRLADLGGRLDAAGRRRVNEVGVSAGPLLRRFEPGPLRRRLLEHQTRLADAASRARMSVSKALERPGDRLAALSSLLDSLSHERVLERGFALVRDGAGHLVSDPGGLAPGDDLDLLFSADRHVVVTVAVGQPNSGNDHPGAGDATPTTLRSPHPSRSTGRSQRRPKPSNPSTQGDLLSDL